MKDHIAQGDPVLALGAAPPGHTDQARQFAIGGAGGHQRDQPDAFFQVQFAADDQLDALSSLARHGLSLRRPVSTRR